MNQIQIGRGSQIYIKGIDVLERECNKLIKEVNEGKTKLLYEGAKTVRARIKQNAPKGPTGNLKKATYAAYLNPTLNHPAVAFAGIRPRKAPHAHLVEFGHGGPHPAPAHPFVRPAWDSVKASVMEKIQQGLKRVAEGGR